MTTTVRTAVIMWLRADPALAALVGARIYPVLLPQSPTYPAVVVTQITELVGYQLRGPAGLDETRIQIDVYAQVADGVDAVDLVDRVAHAVDARLSGSLFTHDTCRVRGCFRITWLDGFAAPEVEAYRVLLEYVIHSRPAPVGALA